MTKNARVILDVIQHSDMRLTAEQIHLQLKDCDAKLVLVTVYNNLNLLYKEGLIKKVSVESCPDRFDKATKHGHLVYKYYGKLSDICLDDLIEQLNAQLEEPVLNYGLKIHYICPECKQKQHPQGSEPEIIQVVQQEESCLGNINFKRGIFTRSITRLDIQYAHRFLNYKGEAQYLHGHAGLLTTEVDGDVDARTGFVYPCNSIKRIVWDFLENFDHAPILQEENPLLPEALRIHETQGIRNDAGMDTMVGEPFENELAKAYPGCRLVVVKKVATCKDLIGVFHSLLKGKLNIKKMTFVSGDNRTSARFQS